MAAEDDGRTEQATGKRLNEARDHGQVAQSPEVRVWASLLSVFIIISLLSGRMARGVEAVILPLIAQPHTMHMTVDNLRALLVELAIGVLKAVMWPFAVMIAVTITAMLVQSKGLLWVPEKLLPDFSRLSPLAGIKRIFSLNQLVELAKQLVKTIAIGSVILLAIWPHLHEYQNIGRLDILGVFSYTYDRVFTISLTVLLVSTVLVGADYFYQYRRYLEDLKMTKQEVRDENKQQEGDPMVKGKLRSIRAKRARQRMMQAVPKADVVVTNPTHYAVALKYDIDTMPAPVLVAKGADLVAKRIRDLATESDVPIVENPPLARTLYATVELDQEIPPEHYRPVAEVIGYVMRLKGKLAR
ncbi:MAG: flagellar biosynthesis protein FlhB [Magnetospirillum sp.]|nr:flagellar biosynthesis protein FlhB [Magnetospirillum sp.]